MGKEYKLVIKNAKGEVVKSEAKLTLEDSTKPYVFTPNEDGVYTVEAGPEGVTNIMMAGVFQGYDFIPVASSGSLLEVVQFGTVKWTTMRSAFNGCCFQRTPKVGYEQGRHYGVYVRWLLRFQPTSDLGSERGDINGLYVHPMHIVKQPSRL